MSQEFLPTEPLRLFPQCGDCLMSLARSLALLSQTDQRGVEAEAEKRAARIIEDGRGKNLNPPEIAKLILREVIQLTGISDPYAQFKAKEMARAKEVFSRVKGYVRHNVPSLITLSLLGNSFDFFKVPEEVLVQVPNSMKKGLAFFCDDRHRLEAFLAKRPKLVLYLADNSGEIYFDLPLYRYIRERCERIILVVKGGPALNDLTRAELGYDDLEPMFNEVMDTGTDGPGIDWKQASEEFLALIEDADLIVSKGVANFECLYPRELPAPVFFLFKAKCEPIQKYLRASPDSFGALWKKGAPDQRSSKNMNDL
jgi:uncharacterized protein with ATP-grasp and redox domains